MNHRSVELSLQHPWIVLLAIVALVALLGSRIPSIQVDTDPENMLPAHEPHRVMHDLIKERFGLHDTIVVGLVNDSHPDGVFNTATLGRLHELSRRILEIDGVVAHDVLSLSTVDNVTQAGPGTLSFDWMMSLAPKSGQQVAEIRRAVERLPLLHNTLVAEDGRAAGIYVPIENKNQSHRIAGQIRQLVAEVGGDDGVHITGLPVAEDTFGVEMFKQMALSAPLAGLVIFLMMWLFFRSVPLVVAPMLVAVATVVSTMGLLIGMGFTVHIMSSMIPIFLMPIAVVDAVHVLSEFADRHRSGRDPRQTVREVMGHLFTPMLYTSITTVVGFASLALTPIPPVRVFGGFVAFGIALAFVLTLTLIPAYVAVLSPRQLAALADHGRRGQVRTPLAVLLRRVGPKSGGLAKPLLLVFALLFVTSLYGITRIRINDNPVRWFGERHPIRVADQVLNQHFAGTYNAFLVLDKSDSQDEERAFEEDTRILLDEAEAAGVSLMEPWSALVAQAGDGPFGRRLESLALALGDTVFEADAAAVPWWEKLLETVEAASIAFRYFQTPEALAYVDALQADLERGSEVGKSNSLVTLVKTLHRELRSGEGEQFRIPDSPAGVAQTLLSFQSSHRPHDLWHMVTPDFRAAALWLQLRSGDNQDMTRVIRQVEDYVRAHPLPAGVRLEWGGLTYINVVWQDAMVRGMVRSLIGAFVLVFIIMVVLFRSVLFGFLAMVPLSFTIVFMYGVIGFVGRDYDMPIAVLSSLTLGLSVDFAIHFLERGRRLYRETGSWARALEELFEEPARAIGRNALVIAVGFLPLLAAPLVPYKTVGLFLASIMTVSAAVTLVLLPSLMQMIHKRLFLGRWTARDSAAVPGGLS